MNTRTKRSQRVEPEEMRQKRIQAAMFSLISNSEFETFMEIIDDLREEAYAYAISDAYVKDERLSLKTLGESCAYNNIVARFEDYKAQLSERIQEQLRESGQG